MRIPNINKIKDERYTDEKYELRQHEETEYDDQVGYDVTTEKNRISFIKYLEKLVRASYEYSEFVNYLKKHLHMDRPSFFQNIDKVKGMSVELHHSPFTLYDICEIYTDIMVENHVDLNPFMISELIIKEHFVGRVGLIPLAKTEHELVHAGQIFIPISAVFGNVCDFYKVYNKYLSQTKKDELSKIIKLEKEMERCKPSILTKKFVYLDIKKM